MDKLSTFNKVLARGFSVVNFALRKWYDNRRSICMVRWPGHIFFIWSRSCLLLLKQILPGYCNVSFYSILDFNSVQLNGLKNNFYTNLMKRRMTNNDKNLNWDFCYFTVKCRRIKWTKILFQIELEIKIPFNNKFRIKYLIQSWVITFAKEQLTSNS